MDRWLYLPPPAIRAIRSISRTTPELLERLATVLDGEPALFGQKLIIQIAATLLMPDEEALDVYHFVEYVHGRVTESKRSSAEALGEIIEYLSIAKSRADGTKKDEFERLSSAIDARKSSLVKLLAPSTNRELAEKVRELQEGPVRLLQQARTFCDIRPIYNREGDTILAWTGTVLLRLSTADSNGESDEFLVQLRRSDLEVLKKEVDRAFNKLEALDKVRGLLPGRWIEGKESHG